MKRLLNIVTLAVTAKALWWDKLSPADQERYMSKAKGFVNTHKETFATKGKQFVADKKPLFEEKKAHVANAFKKDEHPVKLEKDELPTPADIAAKPVVTTPVSSNVL